MSKTVVTLIANPQTRDLSPELAEMAREAIGAETVDWLAPGIACDLKFDELIVSLAIKKTLRALLQDKPIDFVLHAESGRKKKGLIADMDSTMIDQECIDELAAEIGKKDAVSEITARAMNGEIDFYTAIFDRVAMLRGLDANIAEQIIENRITLASGGKTLVATMRANGAYTALVSGGFTIFTSRIAQMLGFDEHQANVLEVQGDKLSGTVRKPILGADAKVEALDYIAIKQSLRPKDFIAVGDGANDIPMLTKAGTGVALHAKPTVAKAAKVQINHGDLTALLYIQGYRSADFVSE